MLYPRLKETETSRKTIDEFYGYNHNLKLRDGEFYNTKNLTTKHFPLLANRPKRGILTELTAAQGIIGKEYLAYVDNGVLYYNGTATPVTGLTSGDKQLIGMGAYIIIFPDGKYYNTADTNDYGALSSSWSCTGSVTYKMCDSDGTEYAEAIEGSTAPTDPDDGDLWIDTSGKQLKQWSGSTSMWVSIETVYTKMIFTTQGQLKEHFKEYDGVEISGAYFDDLNGSKVLYAVGGSVGTEAQNYIDAVYDYIVVIGVLENEYTQTATVTVERKVPELDYVCECQNRLWGCKYGQINGETVNELYCCALGDFKNWSQYLGLSTDSWRASVGSDGEWTGAVNYLGSPYFFKEDRIHSISVSATGAHNVSDNPCRGVQHGSAGSLCVVNETLYYKSRTDVCAYQGGFPVGVSEALGDTLYYDAAAGATGQRYYLSMRDAENNRHLFVYDIAKGLWMREDELDANQFAKLGDELYCLSGNTIYALNGSIGGLEAPIDWEAETGIMFYEYSDKKYATRYNIRLRMEAGARLSIYIEYDSSGLWEFAGNIKLDGTNTVTLPVRPRRCDHMRLKLEGKGDIKLFSITRVLEKGSDM